MAGSGDSANGVFGVVIPRSQNRDRGHPAFVGWVDGLVEGCGLPPIRQKDDEWMGHSGLVVG